MTATYADGVTIKVNGEAVEISAAERQTDHAVIRYTIPAVAEGDSVTWEYAKAGGHIVAESGGTPLQDVAAQAVTNNVSGGPVPLLDLEADTLVLSNGDPVSVWADQSVDGNDFTQSGAARPVYVEDFGDGYPTVYFESGTWMLGANIFDNCESFTVFLVLKSLSDTTPANANAGFPIISKLNNTGDGAGWIIEGIVTPNIWLQDAGGNHTDVQRPTGNVVGKVLAFEKTAIQLNIYMNGTLSNNSSGVVRIPDFSNSEPLRINATGDLVNDQYTQFDMCALRIIAPALDATARAAVEAELAARYGITL
jgi:hypothetical protein